jgi:taurine dioxygenase
MPPSARFAQCNETNAIMPLKLRKLSYGLGAEVGDIKVAAPMSESAFGEKVKRFDNMTEDESKLLIEYLNRHSTRPEFVYRHQWHKHDILLWDNRCTMHMALGDFDQEQRLHMERTTVVGTPSGCVVANA